MVTGEGSENLASTTLFNTSLLATNKKVLAAQGTYVCMYVCMHSNTYSAHVHVYVWEEVGISKIRTTSASKSPSPKPTPLHWMHLHSYVLPTPLTHELSPVQSHE